MTKDLYNLTFEKSILSAILFNPELFFKHKLTPEHFYLPAHQDIYNAMSSLVNDELPIDEEFLKQKLSKAGRFDESSMLDILSANPIANIEPYIEQLLKHRDQRNILNLSLEIKKAVDGEDPVNTVKELLMAIENSASVNKRLPNPTAIDDVVEQESEFILKNWLPFPKKTVSLVTAPGGSGKTWTLLQVAARFCLEDENNRAFLWLSEDPKSLSKARLRKILDKVIKNSPSGLKIDLADDSTPHILNLSHNRVTVDSIWYDLKKIFDNYDLIILDPFIGFFGGDENNNGHARFFMQIFTEYASKNDKTIIFIHHSTKGTAGSRGAGAIVDAVRLHYEIDRITTGKEKEIDSNKLHMRAIRLAKDNYNAIQHLQNNVVERQIFPSVAIGIETIYEHKFEMPLLGGLKDF